ncbi:HD family phosphohydrolase [Oceanivirga salmonicida]|uniref:HD family phosphohydrolase n=1 Tax=Oceanivirga salmonicida TaxID=1769291 RepID=UPI0012E204E2|nr:HDIG domain-containing metalloprotein [Oceanivirga salmonicida]
MKIKIFKKVFEINIKLMDNSINTVRKENNHYQHRMFFLLLVFIIFSAINLYRVNSNLNYGIGTILPKDIIAYKKVVYKKDILDKELENKIYRNTTPEYDNNVEIAQEQIKKFNNFLQAISKLDGNNEKKLKEFIENERLDLSILDLKYFLEEQNLEYYVTLVKNLTDIYEKGVKNKYKINNLLEENNLELKEFEINIIRNFIKPNLTVNKEKTEEKIFENIQALKNNIRTINKGDVLGKKGDVVNADMYDKIVRLGLRAENRTLSMFFNFVFMIVISIIFYNIGKKSMKNGVNSRGFYPTFIIFIFINLLYQLILGKSEILLFLIPFATVSIISNILTKDKIFSIGVSLLTNILLAPNLEWFFVLTILSIIAITNNEKLTNRIELVKNGFKLGAIQALFTIVWSAIYNYDISFFIVIFIFSLISGFLTGMICLGIMPYFENTFSILTEIKLLEIGDYSFPLLKRLLLEAPGTFYHSIMVGALAEQAAEAIGANPTLARVGAYYHDIGKLKRPVYFVENQGGLGNLHDDLKPSLSSVILTSHPKDGVILAKQYGLPDEIINIIIEHHGTTMVQYFYYKAVEIGEKVSEVDFRYTGPKPSSKESAIVMLADTVEAAVRASKDKSKDGIENTIRYLIKYKIDDNQLTNCDINLRDIDKIVNAFLTVLKAAYHERIQYPKINKK